jgi:hypothetical protein
MLALGGLQAQTAQRVNPHQAQIDALNDKAALLEAKHKLDKLRAEGGGEQFPALPQGTGKAGTLEFVSDNRDKFHVTARTADAFQKAAEKLAWELQGLDSLTLLGLTDKAALAAYRVEHIRILQLQGSVQRLTGPAPESMGVIGIAALLIQLSQITQIVREDKSISFTASELPDEIFLDLLAVRMGNKLRYPAASLEAAYTGGYPTDLQNSIRAILARRQLLVDIVNSTTTAKGRKDNAAALLGEIDDLAGKLVALDATTKQSYLMTLVRGEAAERSMRETEGRSLQVSLPSQGGMSLKTSSIWRSDRLYASGGVVVAFRVTGGSATPTVLRAGVLSVETPFVEIPLNR